MRPQHDTAPPGFSIRPAKEEDIPLIVAFIKALADYEKMSGEVKITAADLQGHLFGEQKFAEVAIGEFESQAAGFALFFHNYSTFAGRPGIYLEDLFVYPEFRGKGFGTAMMVHLAALAHRRGCARFEWSVLDWNTPSIDFYKSLGAVPMHDWTVFRLSGEALEALANAASVVNDK